ncbi:hypothetical protein ISF_09948 [Cordyceps fumosorosea ARSEF 2679]|uniref:Uncharacterized protein n=1 Tax=Cordyceps fumosorosea (strain ARSEF 2679) TaxID=1081104 RepID=A0A166Y408_CORFA|nr:hypothetical protein ISF_09948 [Cordyceps fumosorosea ARSEF 2679]OAA36501.1 hypothetical protein ISF_09948 [Cordyceps fumosorosea ARSEF 2679]
MRTSTLFTLATSIAAVAAADCAAPGDYDAQGRYSCNPAHQYPNGQQCKDINGCPLLADATGRPIVKSQTTSSAPAPTGACAAPGDYDAQGRYSCNPAHQYPNGQSCKTVDGCPLLVDANGNAIVKGQTGSSTTCDGPAPTGACAAPGERDSKGRYSCNPAHQYPNGQSCVQIDGCYVLCEGNNTLVTTTGTGTGSPQPTGTGSCAAPGDYDAQGRYSCNPAHQYPNGQSCKTVDGCPLLVDANGNAIVKGQTGSSTTCDGPAPTGACAAPGERDSKGRYSCNPAHQYPNGQSCVQIDGCYVLCEGNNTLVTTTGTGTGSPQPTGTGSCAAPGDYDAQGRYSCNPAHQYPNGQSCKTVDGCPLLVDATGNPITKNGGGSTTGSPVPVVTGAATKVQGGIIAVAVAVAALL